MTNELWVFPLCTALGLSIVFALILLNLRARQKRLRDRMRLRQRERDRIARQFHDTLLQDMQGWVIGTQAVMNRLPAQNTDRKALEHLLRQAEQTLMNGRDQLMEIRIAGELSGGLTSALAAAGAVLGKPSGARLSIHSSGTSRTLDSTASEDIFDLGRETLAHAYRHAIHSIEVFLMYGASHFELHIIHDRTGNDGDLSATTPWHSRSDVYSLVRDRADEIGMRFVVRQQGGRLNIVISAPARFVYADFKKSRLTRLNELFREFLNR